MSDEAADLIRKTAAALAVLTALITLLGAWVVIPHRMEAAEKRIQVLETEAKTAHDLLVRIDENVKALKEARK